MRKKRLLFRDVERPFVAQLLDNDAVRIAEAAARIEEEFHPDMFDINMGCSARSVAGRGAGVGMMRQPSWCGTPSAWSARLSASP